jgi:hypothetical protein
MFSQNKFLFDSATIEIKSLNINSRESEFSPFKIGNNFYFTSSRERKVGITHMDKTTEHQMLDIYKGIIIDSVTIKDVTPLPNRINNSVNQGSCFFDKENSRLYYSSDVQTNSHYKKYKLAIFSSEYKNGEFLQPRIELILADTFSAAHPMLYKERLYFSSNLPGGKGKTDIYYAEKVEQQWANLKNCSFLNTTENEYFPYVINNDEIYFTSNRIGGYGKLDIYKCTGNDSSAVIQNLGRPVNSREDDFGLFMDTLQESGYFATNRKKEQDDIYFFSQTWPVFKNCKEPIVEDYCYNLTEESTLDSDSLKGYYYEWNFGDGSKQKGLTVRHCFKEPGSYLINLSIIDSVTRAVFMSQATFDLKVDSIIQLKLFSLDTVLLNKKFNVSADWTYLPDNKINGYYYEIDGKRMRGRSHDISFSEKGKHKALLGVSTFNLKTKQKELLCTTKEIVCVDSLTWLAVEKRKINELAEKFAYNNLNSDSSTLANINYADEEMAYNKKGLNGALVVAELKKIVDDKIASKTFKTDNLARNTAKTETTTPVNTTTLVATNINTAETATSNPELASIKTSTTESSLDPNDPKYLKPIMDTLMNLKEDDDVNFKVHLGTSKTAKDTTLLNAKGITGISEKKVNDEYHYTYGNEKKLKDIEKYYDKTIKAGIEDAVVVGYKHDSIIGTQSKNISNVDFDKKKNKEDSLRIAKNIEGKNALAAKNAINKLSSDQLRNKASTLLTEAASENLKADSLKAVAETKSGNQKDSLIAYATVKETSSQNKKLEAAALTQKANNIDFDNNSNTVDELLTKLTKDKPALSKDYGIQESKIDSLKTQSEIQRSEAKQIADKLTKISTLKSIEEKEAEILQKQDKLITELKNQSPGYIAKTTNTTNTKTTNTKEPVDSKLTSEQLRLKASNLLSKASEENLTANELKNIASTKSPREKDSLVTKANGLETQSQNDKIEASTLKQKANSLDAKHNDKTINDLLTKLNFSKPAVGKELSIKNKEITSLKEQVKTKKTAANKIPDNLERIAALNLIEEKETEILHKQEQLIADLNDRSIDQIAKNTDHNKTTSENKTNINGDSKKNNSVNNLNTKDIIINDISSEASENENDAKDFIAISDIQKTNLEYLEDFGDLSAEDLEFKVQVGVFKKRTSYNFPKLRGLGKVSNERLKDGSTRMTMGGSYKTLRQAFRHNKRITRAGQSDAFVSVYYKGKRIGIENLRKKGVLVKTQVVKDSVSETKITINASNLTEYAQLDLEEEPSTDQPEGENESTDKFAGNSTATESEENFVFVPRTNIQKKTVFYAEKYGNISADGLEFKVQIAIFKLRSSYSFPKLKSLGKIETETAEEGGKRMTIGGSFKTLNEALEFNKKVVKAGQTDAFVAVYYQSKRIYIENLEKRGIFTSSIKVDKID